MHLNKNTQVVPNHATTFCLPYLKPGSDGYSFRFKTVNICAYYVLEVLSHMLEKKKKKINLASKRKRWDSKIGVT